MSKKGENIYKRKDGRWEGRYILFYDENQKPKYGYVYAKTYSEVKQRLIKEKNVTHNQNNMSKKSIVLYSDILDAWLKSTRISIKESTYARYLQLINSHIRPCLGGYSLSKLTTELIEGFIERKLEAGRLSDKGKLSPKTVSDILTVLKSTIEYAKYKNFDVCCNLGKLTVKKKDKEMRVLCQTEQDTLIQFLVHNIDLYKFGILLSLYTGIRIGELCALQWEDISFETSTLFVRKTMQRIQDTEIGATSKTKVIITEPKSQCSIREIPLPHFIANIAESFATFPKAFVLSGEKNKYIEPRVMQYKFKSYLEESGIEKANFHSLRHTFATRCVELGFELKSLSEILGHANVNITLNKYVHPSFELKQNNMNKLALII